MTVESQYRLFSRKYNSRVVNYDLKVCLRLTTGVSIICNVYFWPYENGKLSR